MILSKEKAVTLVELMIVIGIFFLFLLAFYATMDVGLKQWKLGEVKSDVQGTAEWVMKRMVNELENSNSVAIDAFYDPMDSNVTPYLSFETPVYNGVMKSDSNTGDLLWQGHILYFTLDDPSESLYNTKILYRKYIPHNTTSPYDTVDRTSATLLDNITGYLISTANSASGEHIKEVCGDVTSVRFSHSGCIVYIEIELEENVRKSEDAKVNVATGADVGTDRFVLKSSVKPRN